MSCMAGTPPPRRWARISSCPSTSSGSRATGPEFVAGNTTTGNTTLPTEGGPPLLSDAALFVPLTRGDYYLAVSSGFNYADPEGGLIPGQDGVFDPEIPYKGENGNSIGRY